MSADAGHLAETASAGQAALPAVRNAGPLANLKDDLVGSILAAAAVFSIIGPQGLTWLPAVLALAMAWACRNPAAPVRPAEVVRDAPYVFGALALFCAWTLFRSVTAANPADALSAAVPFCFSLTAVVAAFVPPLRMGFNGRWLWRFFLILHAALSAVLLLLIFKWIDISAIGGERLGQHWHFNRAALFTALLWPISLYVIRVVATTATWRILIGAPLYALALAAVLSASSQSAQLAFLAISATQVLAKISLSLTMRLIGFGASALVLLTPLMFGPIYGWFRGSAAWELNHKTVAERMWLWRSSLDYIWQSPWIGHGVEYIRQAGNVNPDTGAAMTHNHPHSFLFQVWVDTGLVGAAILSALFVIVARMIRGVGGDGGQMFAALMAGIIAIWAVSHGMWQSWFVGLAGLIAAFGGFLHQRSALLARMKLPPDT